MMRGLLSVSLLCWLICWSCASARSGCRQEGERQVDITELTSMTDLTDGVNKFNLQIDIAGKHFSGLLLVKQTKTENTRMVFTSHFGMRIFDFEFIRDSLAVHYCIQPIYKEKIIRLFKHDFSPLFGMLVRKKEMAKIYRSVKDEHLEVWRFPKQLFYRLNVRTGKIEQIVSGRRWRKTTWTYQQGNRTDSVAVSVRHSFLPVSFTLERL